MTDPLSESSGDFVSLLQEHRRRVLELRTSLASGGEGSSRQDLTATVTELEVAHEELRVAEEEMTAQQEQIEELIARNEDERAWGEQLAAGLPVPVLVTDRYAVVTEANVAAAFLLGVDRAHLPGKPLLVYVAEPDRSSLRRALTTLGPAGSELRQTLTLVPRRRKPLHVCVVVYPEPGAVGSRGRMRWVMVPAVPGNRASRHAPDLATAAAFAELCRLPVRAEDDLQVVLGRVATLGRDAVPAATALSVDLGDPLGPELLATESDFAQAVDGAQHRAGEGPCSDAWNRRTTMRSDDVTTDPRWPALQPLVAPLGVRAVLAVPIHGSEAVLGVLNLYAEQVAAFDEDSTDIAELLSVAVGAVVEDARSRAALHAVSEQLRTALDSRAVIDQAKGMLMALHGLSSEEAFAHLVAVSRNSNVKVRDLAERLVEENAAAHRSPGRTHRRQGARGPTR